MNETRDLIRTLRRLPGIEVDPRACGHYRVWRVRADGTRTRAITVPATPSDHRSLRHVRSQLRRHLGVHL